jgi:hypothetical protein
LGRHTNLPFHLYVNVSNKLIGPDMPAGSTKAIWHAVHCRPNQTLMCHILLESGAHWSGMPLHGLSTSDNFDLPRESLMPWSAMGEDVESFHIKYLEGLACTVIKPFKSRARHTGIMIDWADGFSRYPQEHKPLNLLNVESGQFALLPNNYVIYDDSHFVDDSERQHLKSYKRGESVYWGP